jgi:4-amino-4-deoxy-L-arabinose transferase-like glycosyltransferase
MLHAFGTKAPGVAWIGQFFVPIGQLFNSIEFGLLLFIIITQIATLILTYRIGRELCFGHRLIPLAGCVFIASTPLFVDLSHQYFTEPFQLFAVTYFFWISVKAPELGVWEILSHLLHPSRVSCRFLCLKVHYI